MRLKLTIVAILCLAAMSARADDATPLRVIVTNDIERVYYPGPSAVESNPSAKFEAKLDDLRKQYPDAFLLDAGGSISPSSMYETGYSFRGIRALAERDFDAVHLTARDLYFGSSRATGLPLVGAKKWTGAWFSRLAGQFTEKLSFKVPTDVTASKAGKSLRFVSLADRDAVAAWEGMKKEMTETSASEVLGAAKTAGAQTVAVSDMDAAVIARISSSPEHPGLIVMRKGPEHKTPEGGGKTSALVSAPPAGTILLVEMRADGTASSQRFDTIEDPHKLRMAPVGELGTGIKDAETTLAQRLGADREKTAQQMFDGTPYSALTSRKHIYMFQAVIGGEQRRVYRVINGLAFARDKDSVTVMAYPIVDMLIVLRPDHSFDRAVLRETFNVDGHVANMEPFFKSIAGKKPGNWFIDTGLCPGAEEIVEWLSVEISRAIELDTELFKPKTESGGT